MQILNIVLLVLSVGLSIAGLVLIEKPKPMYTLVYPEKTAKKINLTWFYMFFGLGTSLYFFSSSMGVEQFANIFIYSLTILIPLIIYLKNIISLQSEETKKKSFLKRCFAGLIGFLIGALTPRFPMIVVLLIPLAIFLSVFWVIKFKKLNYKGYFYLYLYFFFFALFASSFAFTSKNLNDMNIIRLSEDSIRFLNNYVFPDVVLIAQSVLIFLMFLSIFISVLDVKKYSPIYEKQYIEENSLQTNVSNNP